MPEIYLETGEASLSPFFETLEILMVARKGFDYRIRTFCHRLWSYYNTDPDGKRHRMLLESEQSTMLEKKIFHVDVDGNLYRQATEVGDKRRKVFCAENELGDEGSECGQSSSSTLNSEGLKPPPHAPKSFGLLSERVEPLNNGSGTTSTEEDVAEQRLSAMALLNQKITWKVGDLDLLSKFYVFRDQPRSRFSLALDGIADVTPGSEFALTMSQVEWTLANAACTSDTDIKERWPTVLSILSRVCVLSHSYDDVVKALKREDVDEPIVDYLRDIVYNYSHHLKFSDEVSECLNEREGFGDFTWPFIRGALTMV
ncbi:hypothetical protein EDD11_009572, partial [Mortierella claussenii]